MRGIRIREERADVPEARRTQDRIRDRVRDRVPVRVSLQSRGIGYLHPAQNEGPRLIEAVGIVSDAGSH